LPPQDALKYKEIYNLSRSKDVDIEGKYSIQEIARIYNISIKEVARIIAYVRDKIRDKKGLKQKAKVDNDGGFTTTKSAESEKKPKVERVKVKKTAQDTFATMDFEQLLSCADLIKTKAELGLAVKRLINCFVQEGIFIKGDDGTYGNYEERDPRFNDILSFEYENQERFNLYRYSHLIAEISSPSRSALDFAIWKYDRSSYRGQKEEVKLDGQEKTVSQIFKELLDMAQKLKREKDFHKKYFIGESYDNLNLRQTIAVNNIDGSEKLHLALKQLVKKLLEEGLIANDKFELSVGNYNRGILDSETGLYSYYIISGVNYETPFVTFKEIKSPKNTGQDLSAIEKGEDLYVTSEAKSHPENCQQIYDKIILKLAPLLTKQLEKSKLIP